ncbi:hypothetical protein AB4Y43_16775 [Paraburkholderia sp. BR10872]|uniref:hypothetical protein n=1 Tax=Paraburkholderia sp. BR10872 TaxID=3236989 RepID=UPI0034D3571C
MSEVRKIASIQNEPEGLMRNDFAAAQPSAFAREHFSAPPFSEDRPAASQLDGGRIRIDRDAIYRKVMAAPAALREDENFLVTLLERIRAFIARIFRAIFGKAAGSPDAQAAGAPAPSGIVRDNEHEIVTDSLPESAVGPVQQSVNELIDRALGVDLSPSVRAAMDMPEMDRKPTFRVLLQSNLDDTLACRKLSDSLRGGLEQELTLFAGQHGIEPAAALRILRADLDNVRDGKGGGVLANQIDPAGEMRTHIAELGRLEASLGALARSRSLICEHALTTGVFARDELADLLRMQGHDASFLSDKKTRAQDNVVSLAQFKSATVRTPNGEAANEGLAGNQPHESALSATAEAARPEARKLVLVHDAVSLLAEQGAVDGKPETVEALGRAAAVTDAIADESESEFESDWVSDDFSSFLKKDNGFKPKQKI